MVGSGGEYPRRVGVGFEVDDSEGMVDGVEDRGVIEPVLVGRLMNLHNDDLAPKGRSVLPY